MSDDVLIKVEGVSKKFCRDLKRSLWYGVQDTVADLLGRDASQQELRRDEFWAVDGVSFELRRGECLGLLGRNGAGKTTLLKMLNGLIKPDRGRIEMHGRIGALIALGAGFNPILTGRENVYVNGAVLGLNRKDIDAKFDEIVDFAEIGEFIDTPVQSYSSGMHVRLGFAIATALQPDVLLLDEVLAVGDTEFRAKCFNRIGNVLSGAAVIFVSHSEPQIRRICNEALLLSDGREIDKGSPQKVLATYRRERTSLRPKGSRITDKRLSHIILEVNPRKIQYGGELELTVTVNATSDCRIGAIFCHLWRNEEFVANGESYLRETPIILSPGTSTMLLKIGPLNLPAGKFSISFSAFDETCKQTVLHWLHFAEVEIEGPLGSGPYHLLPMTITSTDQGGGSHANSNSVNAVGRLVQASG